MKTITRKYDIYKFNELDKKTQNKVIEHYYNINTDTLDWSDWTIEELVDRCKKVGVYFNESDVEWSIYSRDNNICVLSSSLSFKWNSNVDLPKKFGAYQDYLGGDIVGKIQTETITKDRVNTLDEEINMENKIVKNLNKALGYFKEALVHLWNNYRELTSDDSIADTIMANDYTFLEDGTMFNKG